MKMSQANTIENLPTELIMDISNLIKNKCKIMRDTQIKDKKNDENKLYKFLCVIKMSWLLINGIFNNQENYRDYQNVLTFHENQQIINFAKIQVKTLLRDLFDKVYTKKTLKIIAKQIGINLKGTHSYDKMELYMYVVYMSEFFMIKHFDDFEHIKKENLNKHYDDEIQNNLEHSDNNKRKFEQKFHANNFYLSSIAKVLNNSQYLL